MNRIPAVIAAALSLATAHLWAGDNATKPQPQREPIMVQAVDAEAGTITIGRKGSEPTTYNFDKKFVRVYVNGKQADLAKVEQGMKVGVVASGNKASRIDAETYVPRAEPKKN